MSPHDLYMGAGVWLALTAAVFVLLAFGAVSDQDASQHRPRLGLLLLLLAPLLAGASVACLNAAHPDVTTVPR